jgi:hypothetical protein
VSMWTWCNNNIRCNGWSSFGRFFTTYAFLDRSDILIFSKSLTGGTRQACCTLGICIASVPVSSSAVYGSGSLLTHCQKPGFQVTRVDWLIGAYQFH